VRSTGEPKVGNGANFMTVLKWISTVKQGCFSSRPGSQVGRSSSRRKRGVRPDAEGLEPLALMATVCPTISGFVFLDENTINPALTNNGLFNTGESPIGNAQVQLFDAANMLVATTTTTADGAYSFGGTSGSDSIAPVTITQTITMGNPGQPNVPTNFTGQPFVPALQRFNPSLGTLQSVQISSDVVYNSSITISNLSQVTPATGISAMLSGASYQIGGLGPTLTISGTPMKSATAPDLPAWNGKPGQEPSDTIDLSVEDKQNPILTSAQDLAFYMAQGAQTTVTPTMTGLGGGVASASNGNGQVSQTTLVGAQLTVTYTYMPTAPCLINPGQYKLVQVPTPPGVIDGKASENGVVFPNPGSPQMLLVTVNTTSDNLINNDFGKLTSSPPVPGMITRFGVHHQRTRLVLPFTGTVDPTLASNPKNYVVVASPTLHIPITSAKFNPATNAVTLIPARRLNFRNHYVLSFHLPTPNGALVNLPFGGKQDLGGFLTEDHRHFIPVSHGRIVRRGRR
jgi:hypothetical protein